MLQGKQLKLQQSATTKAEGERRSESGKIRDHANDGMAGMPKSPGVLRASEFSVVKAEAIADPGDLPGIGKRHAYLGGCAGTLLKEKKTIYKGRLVFATVR